MKNNLCFTLGYSPLKCKDNYADASFRSALGFFAVGHFAVGQSAARKKPD